MSDRDGSDNSGEQKANMVALGDQVQEACARSGANVTGFVLITDDGVAIEYRSMYPLEVFRDRLKKVADAL